jgi:hypothetical protein
MGVLRLVDGDWGAPVRVGTCHALDLPTGGGRKRAKDRIAEG